MSFDIYNQLLDQHWGTCSQWGFSQELVPNCWILYPQLLDHIYISNCWILYLTVFLNLVLSSGLTDQMNCTTDHVLSCTVNGYNNTRVRDRSAY